MDNRPGTLADEFTLHTPDGPIHAEIRLVVLDDGTETLWHYENGTHRFSHTAKRCDQCNTLLTGDHIGRSCLDCARVR